MHACGGVVALAFHMAFHHHRSTRPTVSDVHPEMKQAVDFIIQKIPHCEFCPKVFIIHALCRLDIINITNYAALSWERGTVVLSSSSFVKITSGLNAFDITYSFMDDGCIAAKPSAP